MPDLNSATRKTAYGFLTILYLASFILSIFGYATGNRLMYGIFKAMFMPTIIAITYLTWSGARSKNYTLLQLGFTFAWVGDILIALPKTSMIFLFIGGWCFLCQHVFYIWLHLSAKGPKTHLWKTPFWGLPTLAYIVLFNISYWARGNLTDKLQFFIYSTMLGTSFYTAFYRELKSKAAYVSGILGFTLFVISDVIILLENFVLEMTNLQASSILLTYYIAQTLICYSHVTESKEVPV
eukprot:TRINITY_DN14324_c0_g1_i6.p1 TRINITY_DN14324_c0_g1~~TRINITY_DN14324_c0_g1_i6.p1  ORF type:complete len:238 (-),score=36.15 TRINITY_DN14324_c0_g1_i6:112-825(-)